MITAQYRENTERIFIVPYASIIDKLKCVCKRIATKRPIVMTILFIKRDAWKENASAIPTNADETV